MRVADALRNRAGALRAAADEAFPDASNSLADDYEACGGLAGAVTLFSAYVTYKVVEAGAPLTGRDTLIGLGATILSSIGAAVFYDKSRDLRREE